MSILASKHALIVSCDANPGVDRLVQTVVSQGMTVTQKTCDEVVAEVFDTDTYDVIFINLLTENSHCTNTVRTIASNDTLHATPIFALVEKTEEAIQNALALGAADYITETEDEYSVLDKVHTLLSQTDVFSDTSILDISDPEPSVSKSGIKVYVIEDDPLLQNLLSIRLKKSNFPFEFSSNGQQAVATMKQFKPDVLILDLMLPGVEGLDVLQQIRDDEMFKDLPVIVFSNRDNPADKARATELRVAGFYVKAMTDLSDLMQKIQKMVN